LGVGVDYFTVIFSIVFDTLLFEFLVDEKLVIFILTRGEYALASEKSFHAPLPLWIRAFSDLPLLQISKSPS
jgi:hypothetical protein